MARVKTEQDKVLDKAMDLIIESGADLQSMFKEGGLLKQLTKNLVERALKAEPILVPKRSNRIDGLDDKIISLYAKGMSVSDIKIQLE